MYLIGQCGEGMDNYIRFEGIAPHYVNNKDDVDSVKVEVRTGADKTQQAYWLILSREEIIKLTSALPLYPLPVGGV